MVLTCRMGKWQISVIEVTKCVLICHRHPGDLDIGLTRSWLVVLKYSSRCCCLETHRLQPKGSHDHGQGMLEELDLIPQVVTTSPSSIAFGDCFSNSIRVGFLVLRVDHQVLHTCCLFLSLLMCLLRCYRQILNLHPWPYLPYSYSASEMFITLLAVYLTTSPKFYRGLH